MALRIVLLLSGALLLHAAYVINLSSFNSSVLYNSSNAFLNESDLLRAIIQLNITNDELSGLDTYFQPKVIAIAILVVIFVLFLVLAP
ncbi:hypothetical protein L596_026137 [Steinernema carpocapsae]|uniref:Uncharacterized protein n=1 Tax=Steinernema carpocapsae TaxID=34508 RepID=A0A4U5M0H9_STECR|nr:hypothetical protein L596_026137 [Steinernema carpocapsae]